MPRTYTKVCHPPRPCDECAAEFQPFSVRSRFCSRKCAYRAHERERMTPCSGCAKPMWRSREMAATPLCLSCRRARSTYQGKIPKPAETWTCASCGVICERPATRGQRPKLCTDCRTSDWISPTQRHAIYERDGWTCWLCEEPVDRDLIGSRDHWRPSLDHVIPRSSGGSNEDSNLRLAHWWCNCVRSDAKHQPEVFRATA